MKHQFRIKFLPMLLKSLFQSLANFQEADTHYDFSVRREPPDEMLTILSILIDRNVSHWVKAHFPQEEKEAIEINKEKIQKLKLFMEGNYPELVKQYYKIKAHKFRTFSFSGVEIKSNPFTHNTQNYITKQCEIFLIKRSDHLSGIPTLDNLFTDEILPALNSGFLGYKKSAVDYSITAHKLDDGIYDYLYLEKLSPVIDLSKIEGKIELFKRFQVILPLIGKKKMRFLYEMEHSAYDTELILGWFKLQSGSVIYLTIEEGNENDFGLWIQPAITADIYSEHSSVIPKNAIFLSNSINNQNAKRI